MASFRLRLGDVETDLIDVAAARLDTAVIDDALAAETIDFEVTGGSGTAVDPWVISYTGGATAERLQALAYSDAAGTTELTRFGILHAQRTRSAEIQSLELVDRALIESLELSLAGQTVTWTKSGGQFVIADFHAANETATSPKLPIVEVTGQGTSQDPWQFRFNDAVGDAPRMSVVARDGSNAVISDNAQLRVLQDGQSPRAELQAVASPGYTFRFSLAGGRTAALSPTTTASEVAGALRQLTTLPLAVQQRIAVSGDGQPLSPWVINFGEPGARPLLVVEPAWLQIEQAPTAANGQTAKLSLNLDAATSGTFRFSDDGIMSSPVGSRPTAAAVQTALAALLGNGVDQVEVNVVGRHVPVVGGGARLSITLSGVNPVAVDLELLSIDAASLNVMPAPTVAQLVAGTTYDPGQPGSPQEHQQVRSKLTSGTFQLVVGNRRTANLAFDASGSAVQQALIDVLGHDRVTVDDPVVASDVRTWNVRFAAELGEQPLLQAITEADRTQRISGFTGTVRNVDGINYGPGINVLIGSNTDLETAQGSFQDLMSGSASFGDFVEGFFGSGLQAGNDTFEVGGNLLNLAKDWLISQSETASGLQEKLENNYPFVNSLVDSMLGPWFGGTVAPGAHLLAGLSGGDTYRFSGIWGAAAVLELPDVEVVGVSVPEGFDTLDLSEAEADVTIDVYRLSLSDLPGYEDLLRHFGDFLEEFPPLDVVANIMVVRDDSISQLLSGYSLGAVDPSEIFGGEAGNVLLALDIENLVLGKGKTTLRFHGDAEIQGTVAANDDGTVVLDYRESTRELDVDGQGGIQWEIIPSVELIPEFQLGDLTINAVEYPGVSFELRGPAGSRVIA